MSELDFIQPKKVVGRMIDIKVLEDIKAEIKAHSEMHYMDGDIIADELLAIIDKYMRGTELST